MRRADQTADDTAETGGEARAPCVLLIDDDPDEALLLTLARDVAGVDLAVVHARCGADGLVLAGELCPDIVLVDLSMPGMDGFETIARLSAAPECCEAERIVAFSTSRAPEDRERALAAGASAYRSKPRAIAEYVSLVREIAGAPPRRA